MNRTSLAGIFFRYKVHHLLFWIGVGLVWFYLRLPDYRLRQNAINITIIKTLDLALMVSVANYLLVPRLLYRKRYAWFAGVFLLMIVASSLAKMQIIGSILNVDMFAGGNIRTRIYDNMIPHFFLVTAGVAFKLVFDYLELERRLAIVSKEKAETELSFLKSQINPHFLFNSLNSVYFLIDKKNTEARAALHKFSDMLRYQLYELNDQKVPVEKEIAYLEDYIAMQQLRREHSRVNFVAGADLKGFSLEPLILIPFVENAFKHLSAYADRENRIDIGLEKKACELLFSVRNTTEGKQAQADSQGGIGLKNVKRRLELLYPGRYELTIREPAGYFEADLSINLNGQWKR